MKRRGFLASAASLLTFSAFEKRCMAEVGVSSPIQIAAPAKIWGIRDSEMDMIIAISPSEDHAKRMAIIFNYDLVAEGEWPTQEFENAVCEIEGIDFDDDDDVKMRRKINRGVVQWCRRKGATLLPRKGDDEVQLSPNRPSFEIMKAISEVFMGFEAEELTETFDSEEDVVVLTGNDDIKRNGDPYKPTGVN